MKVLHREVVKRGIQKEGFNMNGDLTIRRRRFGYRTCMRLLLATMIVFCLGTQGSQAATGDTNRMPVLTKSGKKAALQQAAADILQRKNNTLAPTSTTQTSGPPKAAAQFLAAPANATDPTKVPHYFGPFPNWANSPFTLADAAVVIGGDGSGAAATATIGPNGSIADITVVNPGSGYTTAPVIITTTGGGSNATATAAISTTGVVTAIDITNNGGSGYSEPVVQISGGGATIDATATAYGGVENNITVLTPGGGYTNPTVEFDLPDGPDGVKAVGHVLWNTGGQVTGIVSISRVPAILLHLTLLSVTVRSTTLSIRED